MLESEGWYSLEKGPANRIWNVGMFTGTALVPNGMPGGVRGRVITGPTRFFSANVRLRSKKDFYVLNSEQSGLLQSGSST